MQVRDLRDLCAAIIGDPSYGELTKATWMLFFAAAGMDARSAGWLLHAEDNESVTVVANTWEYTVPAGFAYIEGLILSETLNGTTVYIQTIPQSHWSIRLNGGVPVFTFSLQHYLVTGRNIKVVGQTRPTIYTDENETIDRGMESFIRERALMFAFRRLGIGLSELARWRQQMATQSWQTSQLFLQNHPQEFRMAPSALIVPGRG